jgi:hypothetical protein
MVGLSGGAKESQVGREILVEEVVRKEVSHIEMVD